MSHPIKDPLPDRLLCHPDGTLSMQDGSDVKAYLASVLALHGITTPIETFLLPRLEAEQMREVTVHMKQLQGISMEQLTELAQLRAALQSAKEEAERARGELAETRAKRDEYDDGQAHWFNEHFKLRVERDALTARLAVADAALAEARGLVEFLNKPLPVNSRAALVERCYQVQLICETIPPHENQTKTAIALSELVTAIRESGGRDETLADLAKAREDAAGFQADLQSVQRENAALREAGDRLFRHAGVLVKYKNNQEEPLWQNLCNGINAWDRAIQGAALSAALHPATKEGKAE